jgi:hypothetical protein
MQIGKPKPRADYPNNHIILCFNPDNTQQPVSPWGEIPNCVAACGVLKMSALARLVVTSRPAGWLRLLVCNFHQVGEFLLCR